MKDLPIPLFRPGREVWWRLESIDVISGDIITRVDVSPLSGVTYQINYMNALFKESDLFASFLGARDNRRDL